MARLAHDLVGQPLRVGFSTHQGEQGSGRHGLSVPGNSILEREVLESALAPPPTTRVFNLTSTVLAASISLTK